MPTRCTTVEAVLARVHKLLPRSSPASRLHPFVHGSRRNGTAASDSADVDIGILCRVPTSIPFEQSRLLYDDLKSSVASAMRSHLGAKNVEVGRKTLKVTGLASVATDITVFLPNHSRLGWRGFRDGVIFFVEGVPDPVINWPIQHRQNAAEKNSSTCRRFKPLVRELKRATLRVKAEKPDTTPAGFLLESVVWNVPNCRFAGKDRKSALRSILAWLENELGHPSSTLHWLEINGIKRLFDPERPLEALRIQHAITLVRAEILQN